MHNARPLEKGQGMMGLSSGGMVNFMKNIPLPNAIVQVKQGMIPPPILGTFNMVSI